MKLGLLLAALCGSGLIVLVTWFRRRGERQLEASALNLRLAQANVHLEQQRIGQMLDEGKRASAKARQAEVDRKKREAAQIASGRPVALIRRVG